MSKPVCKKVMVGTWFKVYSVVLDGEEIGQVEGTRHNAKVVVWEGLNPRGERVGLAETRAQAVEYVLARHEGRLPGPVGS